MTDTNQSKPIVKSVEQRLQSKLSVLDDKYANDIMKLINELVREAEQLAIENYKLRNGLK